MFKDSSKIIRCFFTNFKVADEFINSIHSKKSDNVKVIVSSYNFDNTPSSEALGNLVARIQATGADIVKIVTTALDISDVARIFKLTTHSQVRTFLVIYVISTCCRVIDCAFLFLKF